MCLGKPECQRCETCGLRKYQFWVDREMHDRGCPWSHERMDQCADAIGHAKMLAWGAANGVALSESGSALVEQMASAGALSTEGEA